MDYCDFVWCVCFGFCGVIFVFDVFDGVGGCFDVMVLGFILVVCMKWMVVFICGELMCYFVEFFWVFDVIFVNRVLYWCEGGLGELIVGVGEGVLVVEILLGLDSVGWIVMVFVFDCFCLVVELILLMLWCGSFLDYWFYLGCWILFVGEVVWEIDGCEELYW